MVQTVAELQQIVADDFKIVGEELMKMAPGARRALAVRAALRVLPGIGAIPHEIAEGNPFLRRTAAGLAFRASFVALVSVLFPGKIDEARLSIAHEKLTELKHEIESGLEHASSTNPRVNDGMTEIWVKSNTANAVNTVGWVMQCCSNQPFHEFFEFERLRNMETVFFSGPYSGQNSVRFLRLLVKSLKSDYELLTSKGLADASSGFDELSPLWTSQEDFANAHWLQKSQWNHLRSSESSVAEFAMERHIGLLILGKNLDEQKERLLRLASADNEFWEKVIPKGAIGEAYWTGLSSNYWRLGF